MDALRGNELGAAGGFGRLLENLEFAERGIEVAVVEVVGALDRAVADGLADGVVALIAAAPEGAGQASFAGLAVEGVVAASSVRLVAGRGARVLHTAELGTLVARLRELTAGGDTP